MTLMIIAVLGWLLFLIVSFMYWVGIKINANEIRALEFFFLATLTSEEYWKMNHNECVSTFGKMSEKGFSHSDALKASCDALLEAGKNAMIENLEIARRNTADYFSE